MENEEQRGRSKEILPKSIGDKKRKERFSEDGNNNSRKRISGTDNSASLSINLIDLTLEDGEMESTIKEAQKPKPSTVPVDKRNTKVSFELSIFIRLVMDDANLFSGKVAVELIRNLRLLNSQFKKYVDMKFMLSIHPDFPWFQHSTWLPLVNSRFTFLALPRHVNDIFDDLAEPFSKLDFETKRHGYIVKQKEDQSFVAIKRSDLKEKVKNIESTIYIAPFFRNGFRCNYFEFAGTSREKLSNPNQSTGLHSILNFLQYVIFPDESKILLEPKKSDPGVFRCSHRKLFVREPRNMINLTGGIEKDRMKELFDAIQRSRCSRVTATFENGVIRFYNGLNNFMKGFSFNLPNLGDRCTLKSLQKLNNVCGRFEEDISEVGGYGCDKQKCGCIPDNGTDSGILEQKPDYQIVYDYEDHTISINSFLHLDCWFNLDLSAFFPDSSIAESSSFNEEEEIEEEEEENGTKEMEIEDVKSDSKFFSKISHSFDF